MTRRCVVVGSGCMGVSTAIALQKRANAYKQSINESTDQPNYPEHVYDEIVLMDRGSLIKLHPLAASNDLSRIVRSDYGSDRLYTDLAVKATKKWEEFNQQHCPENPVFVKTGVAILTEVPMETQSLEHNQTTQYEWSSFQLMKQLGQPVTRLNFNQSNNQSVDQSNNQSSQSSEQSKSESVKTLINQTINETRRFVDGYFNANAGWVDAGRATELAIKQAISLGVVVKEYHELIELMDEPVDQSNDQSNNQSRRVTGVKVTIHSPADRVISPTNQSRNYSVDDTNDQSANQSIDETIIDADQVILCCGAWTPTVVPYTKTLLKASAQPVLYFAPPQSNDQSDGQLSEKAQMFADLPVFAMSLASRGFYGFPLSKRGLPDQSNNPTNNLAIKIAHHGPGSDHHPSNERSFDQSIKQSMFDYIYSTIPCLSDCSIMCAKTCFYCDAIDGDWLMDYHQTIKNVFIASGDSGHAFKFLPVIGDVIVGCMSNQSNNQSNNQSTDEYEEYKKRFKWRDIDQSKATYDVCRAGPLEINQSFNQTIKQAENQAIIQAVNEQTIN